MPETKSKSNTGLIAGIIGGVVAVVAIIIVVVIIIANGGKNDFVGTWKLTKMTERGTVVEGDLLDALGAGGTIEFRNDGTGTVKMNGEADSEFKYDKDKKTLTADGQTKEIKLDGKTITIEVETGISATYTKQ
jgi:hypothetical protein